MGPRLRRLLRAGEDLTAGMRASVILELCLIHLAGYVAEHACELPSSKQLRLR
jgi:hypothetical protein